MMSKNAEAVILRINFKLKGVKRDKEGHYILRVDSSRNYNNCKYLCIYIVHKANSNGTKIKNKDHKNMDQGF